MEKSKARLDPHPSDHGCSLHPKCLECIEPVCRHDSPVPLSVLKRRTAMQQNIAVMSNAEVAALYGVTKRTVERARAAAMLRPAL